MRIGLETEQRTEEDFINLAYKYDIPLVATNEAFFLMLICMKRMMRWLALLPVNMLPTITAKSFRPITASAPKRK